MLIQWDWFVDIGMVGIVVLVRVLVDDWNKLFWVVLFVVLLIWFVGLKFFVCVFEVEMESSVERFNILVLVVDDLGYNDVLIYNFIGFFIFYIDWIVVEGVVFICYYVDVICSFS